MYARDRVFSVVTPRLYWSFHPVAYLAPNRQILGDRKRHWSSPVISIIFIFDISSKNYAPIWVFLRYSPFLFNGLTFVNFYYLIKVLLVVLCYGILMFSFTVSLVLTLVSLSIVFNSFDFFSFFMVAFKMFYFPCQTWFSQVYWFLIFIIV